MRVLFYSAHPHLYFNAPTGYGSHMRGMVSGMEKAGHEVHVLVLGKEPKSSIQPENSSRIKSMLKRFIPSILWRTLKEIQLIRFDKIAGRILLDEVNTFQPELIYERASWMSCAASAVANLHQLRHVIEVNAPFEEEVTNFEKSKSFIQFIGRKRFKKTLQAATLVAPVTSSLRTYLIKNYQLQEKKCIVFPNAISREEIQTEEIQVASIRDTFSLEGKIVIGFIGSIFPYHGLDRLITAVHKLDRTFVQLFIVGDGLIIPELKELAKTLNVSEQVTFVGSVSKKEIYNYLSAMDIVTLPNTEWYCSPVKVFEYGACGKIVVAVNAPGVSDVMSSADGILFENNDGALLEALSEAIDNFDFHQKNALEFQKKIHTNYTWEANSKRLFETLHSLK